MKGQSKRHAAVIFHPPKRGFAAMKPEAQRELARQGGKAAHAKGTGHQWTRAEAAEAGHKGGRSRKKKA